MTSQEIAELDRLQALFEAQGGVGPVGGDMHLANTSYTPEQQQQFLTQQILMQRQQGTQQQQQPGSHQPVFHDQRHHPYPPRSTQPPLHQQQQSQIPLPLQHHLPTTPGIVDTMYNQQQQPSVLQQFHRGDELQQQHAGLVAQSQQGNQFNQAFGAPSLLTSNQPGLSPLIEASAEPPVSPMAWLGPPSELPVGTDPIPSTHERSQSLSSSGSISPYSTTTFSSTGATAATSTTDSVTASQNSAPTTVPNVDGSSSSTQGSHSSAITTTGQPGFQHPGSAVISSSLNTSTSLITPTSSAQHTPAAVTPPVTTTPPPATTEADESSESTAVPPVLAADAPFTSMADSTLAQAVSLPPTSDGDEADAEEDAQVPEDDGSGSLLTPNGDD